MRKAFICGITSDIGQGIAGLLEQDGWKVLGTSSRLSSHNIWKIDLANSSQISNVIFEENKIKDWTLLCLFAGTMEPIGSFFECDSKDWERSFYINLFSQLNILKKLWNFRSKKDQVNVCFLAGGGTNSTFDNYSAYCISKIALIKFVELIASENKKEKFFIIGPGFMDTKIHNETYRAGDKAGTNLNKTKKLSKGAITSITRLYRNIMWCVNQPIESISGRNFSTVNDPWDTNSDLGEILTSNPEVYKLRRKGLDAKEV